VAYPVLEAAGQLPVRDSERIDLQAADALTYQPKLP
jgi:hypothetical protein